MNEMSVSDARRLVDGLTEATSQSKLTWRKFASSDDEFSAGTSNFMYYVGSVDDDQQPPWRLQIWRRNADDGSEESGKFMLVEELTSDEAGYSEVIHPLYVQARRMALGLDRLVSDALDDLVNGG